MIPKTGLHADIEDLRDHLMRVSGIDHPAVNKIVHIQEDARCFYTFVDFASASLLEFVCRCSDNVSEGTLRAITAQMLDAVDCCLANSVPLRGLTLFSFGVSGSHIDFQVRLHDFGWSRHGRWFDKCKRQFVDNYMDFMAPETFSGQIAATSCVWSVGLILYVLFCGHTPFSTRSGATRLFPDQHWGHASKSGVDLVRRMMVQNPCNRPSAKALLQHPWFQNVDAGSTLPESVVEQHKEQLFSWRLRKAAMYGMARQLTVEKLRELRRIYQTLDQDKTGSITMHEMRFALMHFPGFRTDPSLTDLFGTKQSTPDRLAGTFNYAEFIDVAMAKKAALQEDACWLAFQKVGVERAPRSEAIACVRSTDVVRWVGPDISRQVADVLEMGSRDEVSLQELITLMGSIGTVNEFWNMGCSFRDPGSEV